MARKVEIGDCTLWLGDALAILPTLTGVDACVCDPPYGIGFAHGGNDNSGIGGGRYATAFAGEAIHGDDAPFDPSCLPKLPSIIWGANHFCDKLPGSPSWLVWDKRASSGHCNDFADCEMAWTNLGGVARVFRHHWDGMMKSSERTSDAKAHRPDDLVSWLRPDR